MKRALISLSALFVSIISIAQVPESFNYQAIPRNSSGGTYPEQAMNVQISIIPGSPDNSSVYTETFNPTTTSLGLLNLQIGTGTPVTGTFSEIDWSSGSYYLKVEIDPAGGTSYVEMGVTQLLSVPYALHAKTAETLTDNNAVEGNLITYDGTNWVAKNATTNNTGSGHPLDNMQPWTGIYHIIALTGTYPSRSGYDPYIAEIAMFAGNFPPRGWAFCDGQLLPINQNTALFSLIGTTFGGDGQTIFGLPDLRGRVAIHPGNGPGLASRQWGQKGGSETNTITTAQMPAHNHVIIYQ